MSLLRLIFIVVELAAIAGLVYLAKYTLMHRSGLNDPEKIQRIWRRARDIRYQPVFWSMPFSISVGYGLPAAIATTLNCLSGIALPMSIFQPVSVLTSFLVLIASGAVTPLFYRMGGGQKIGLNIIGMALTSVIMTSLLFSDIIPLIASKMGQSTSILWIATLITCIFLLLLQIPLIIAGIRYPLPPLGQRIYNPSLLPNWVRLNRAVAIAAGPIMLARLVYDVLRHHAHMTSYLPRLSILLARLITMIVCSLASIISVNRALLAEDFRWQWRAFLTPAIPIFAYELLDFIRRLIIGTSTPLTRLGLLIHLSAEAGAWGVFGVFIYLLFAEMYTKDAVEPDEDYEEELFGSDLADEDPELFDTE